MGMAKDIKYARDIQFNVESKKGEAVKIFGVRYDSLINLSFQIGDEAVYDAYNFSYTGKIVSITDKTVTIKGSRTRRLKLEDFGRWNYDFDAEKIARERYEWSHYN